MSIGHAYNRRTICDNIFSIVVKWSSKNLRNSWPNLLWHPSVLEFLEVQKFLAVLAAQRLPSNPELRALQAALNITNWLQPFNLNKIRDFEFSPSPPFDPFCPFSPWMVAVTVEDSVCLFTWKRRKNWSLNAGLDAALAEEDGCNRQQQNAQLRWISNDNICLYK